MSTQDVAADTQAAVNAAVAAAQATATQAQDEAVAAAVAAERGRIAAITGSDEAVGRESQATHIAMNTTMSVDDAKAMLAASAKSTPAQANADMPFGDAMDTGNPDVGANGGSGGSGDAVDDVADLRALAGAVGLKGFAARNPQ